MKRVGLLLSVALLAAVSWAGTQRGAAKHADAAPAPLSSLCQADEMLERLPPVLKGTPLGGNGVIMAPREQAPWARTYGYDRGPDYKLRIIRPSREIDYKIVRIRPDPNVDYQIRNFHPGGCDAYLVPRADGRRAIIIDPKRGGRGK